MQLKEYRRCERHWSKHKCDVCVRTFARSRSGSSIVLANVTPEYRNIAIMTTIAISDVTMIQRTTEGKPVRVYIPAKYIKIVKGVKYIKVATRDWFIAKLFGISGYACIGGTTRKRTMHCTDVVEQLTAYRNREIHNQMYILSGANDLNEELSQKDFRVTPDIKLQLPEVIEFDTPIIGHVQSVRMQVICSHNQRAPLFMKLVNTNIEYCMNACMHQIESGGVRSKKRKMETSDSSPQVSQPSTPLADAVSPLAEDAIDENASPSAVSAPSSPVDESPVAEHMPDVQQLVGGARRSTKITEFFAKRS